MKKKRAYLVRSAVAPFCCPGPPWPSPVCPVVFALRSACCGRFRRDVASCGGGRASLCRRRDVASRGGCVAACHVVAVVWWRSCFEVSCGVGMVVLA